MSGLGDTAVKVWGGISDRRSPADRDRSEAAAPSRRRTLRTARDSRVPSARREPVALSSVADSNARSLIALREALDGGLNLWDAIKSANERLRAAEAEGGFG